MNEMPTPHQRMNLFSKIIKHIGACCSVVLFLLISVSASAQTYCIPGGSPYTTRYINQFFVSTPAGEQFENYSAYTLVGYSDYTFKSASQEQGGIVTFWAKINGSPAGFRIWVDWNQDGQFDTQNEVAYQSSELSNTYSASFLVPEDALLGSTRMRIVSNIASATGLVDPCISPYYNGEFEDYTFVVTDSGIWDCPDLEANIGDGCTNGDDAAGNYVVGEGCECDGTLIFDCPALEANIGDVCDDGDTNTINDVIGEDCLCVGIEKPSGTICEYPNEVNALPFTASGNLGTYGNNYASGDVPQTHPGGVTTGSASGSYLNGDEVVFAYTPTENQIVNISTINANDWISLWVFTGCPFISTYGYHLAPSGITRSINELPLLEGTTYYIVISNWPTVSNLDFTISIEENVLDCPVLGVYIGSLCDDGDSGTYDDVIDADCNCVGTPYECQELEVNIGDACDGDPSTTNNIANENCECEGEATNPGEICGNPLIISELPYTTSDSTGNYGNNYEPDDFPDPAEGVYDFLSKYFLTGDETVYAYTPNEDQIIEVSVTKHSSWTGVFVFTGCPFESTVGLANSSDTMALTVDPLSVQAGVTYYIVISTNSILQSTDYTLNVTQFTSCADTPSAGIPDEDALLVCVGEEFTLNVSGASDPSAGLSNIWQSSPFGENDWTAIQGASAKSLNLSGGIEVATDYRYVVTCSFSGETDVSDVIQVSVNPNIAECLCFPSVLVGVEPITYVNFGNIDNTSDALSSVGYEDFTDQSTPLNPGESFEITVKGNTNGNYTNNFTVFIDWNQNGVFVDAGEIYQIGSIKNSSGTDGKSVTGNIVVPLDALPGNTRMRIQKTLTGALMDQCDGFNYGQTEDYTVTVIEMEACAATPSAGTPDVDALVVCAGEEFTINVSGVSVLAFGLERIWQSSPAGESDWTAIEGASSKSLSILEGIEAPTDYRYVVTCSINDEVDVSDVIQVSLNPNNIECVCTPSFSILVRPITYVNFGSIQNTSGYISNDAYEDFTDQTTQVTRGETYPISSKGYTGGDFTSYFTVFVDWNQNGILDDYGEVYHIGSIQYSNGTDQKITSGDIDVPLGALLGSTRMRVLKTYLAYQTDPCGSYYYGQAEDYTLVVESEPVWDCPDLAANVGDSCDDGDAATENDVVGNDCECTEVIIYDCPALEANFGDACDDGDPTTINDAIGEDCLCGSNFINGSVCENAIAISELPYTTMDYTTTYGNYYEATDFPPIAPDAMGDFSALYLSGNDVVYSYTPASDGLIAIEVSNHGSQTGLFVFTGCPFESVVGGHTNPQPSVHLKLKHFPVQAGLTYYIVISTSAPRETTYYTLTVTESPYDCPDLQVNFGHPCDDGNPLTGADRINEDCECAGDLGYTEASAIPIYCNTDPITYSSVNSNATKPTNTFCGSIMGNKGLYFSFIGTGSEVMIHTAAGFKHGIQVGRQVSLGEYSYNTCATGGFLIGGIGFSTEADEVYYVYIGDYYTGGGSNSTGDITISIECDPNVENNDCENAFPLTCGASVEGSLRASSKSGLDAGSCTLDEPKKDVFFTLEVLEGVEYTLSVTAEFNFYSNILVIYSGLCGNLTEIQCSTNNLDPEIDNEITFTAYTSETLIVRIYGYGYFGPDFTIAVSCNVVFDCPDLEANIGDACDDNDENTENDIINEYCDCLGTASVPPTNPFISLQSLVAFTSYPSPTKGPSKVVFTTGVTTPTLLEVYDLNGRNIGTLFNQEAQKGQEYTIDFNGNNLPNGVYIYRITTNDETIIEKFMIAR